MKRKVNANQFLECSAKNNENVNEVIYEAVRAAVAGVPELPKKSCCSFLEGFFCCAQEDF